MAEDEMLGLSLVRLLEVVGEAAAQVPADLRQRYPLIPWRDLTDLRNLPIHAYHRVDYALIWQIVSEQLQPLVDELLSIIQAERSK